MEVKMTIHKLRSNNVRKAYNRLNKKIEAEGQNSLENNSDSRIAKIFNFIVENEIEAHYETFSSVNSIKLANKSDSEVLWKATQPRDSNNNDERMLDQVVENRALKIVDLSRQNEWVDFDNPPIYFQKNDKVWIICGNGRIASLRLAEKHLEKDIPFHMVRLNLDNLNELQIKAFCTASSQTSNSDDGKSVEKKLVMRL